ncbi:hypothetical protein D3C87_1062350 [compost metagenome]
MILLFSRVFPSKSERMFPVFFSVSNSNIGFAQSAWEAFPSDWIYLFSKNGRHGAHMWDEIAQEELPKAKVFIIFWSKDYPVSTGCVKEIVQASALFQSGAIKPVIVRLDDYPLHWKEGINPDLKPVFDALKPLLEFRASDPWATVEQARTLIAAEIEPLLLSDHPRMARHDVMQALRKTLQKERFKLYPACWISGFNGVGRESLLRAVCRDLTPNGRGFVIEVNEATLPHQLLLRIESEALGADYERIQQLQKQTEADELQAVAQVIERVFDTGNYIILRHGRIVQEEVELPDWIDDVASLLKDGARPKVFIVSQLPLTGERLIRSREFLTTFRVPTVDEHHMLEFCYDLIGYFDQNAGRWRDDDVERIARGSGGTVGFLVSIVRSASRMENFNTIEAMLAHEDAKMGEAITAYVRWAFSELRDYVDEQKVLLFLNDVSPCHIADLEKAVSPHASILRSVGKLIEIGLVERETDDLYRLTPLLARRLNRDLLQPELVKWVEEAQRAFASAPFEATASSAEYGHEFIRLEARIQAALLSGSENLNFDFGVRFSASYWFQAGIRLYHARKWTHAYRLLKKTYKARQQFRHASRVEIARYFGLAATRMRKYSETEDCIQILDGDHRSKEIAIFLKADMHEYRREFPEAVNAYETALLLNKDKERRREFIYRPLIRCILATKSPDFVKAERRAKSYILLRRTVFSLASLARVYLLWKHRGAEAGAVIPHNIDSLYRDALADLEGHPGAGAAPFELYSEEAEFTGDFDAALTNMDQAIIMDPDRFQLRSERWRIMARSGTKRIAIQALRELDQAKKNTAYAAVWPSYIDSLADTYVRLLHTDGQSLNLVNAFAPELQQGRELGRIIARVRREKH